MLVGGYESKQAIKQFKRILNDPKRQELKEGVGEPMRVNNRGQACYCASGTLMHMILMCLPPGRLSNKYMAECARVLHMRDTGDSRLISEVQHNSAAAVANGGAPPVISLFGTDKSTPTLETNNPTIEVLERQLALREREQALVEREQALVERQVVHKEHGLKLEPAAYKLAEEERRKNLVVIEEQVMVSLESDHTNMQLKKKQLLEELELFDDVKKFIMADRIMNYNPRKRILHLHVHDSCVLDAPGRESLEAAPHITDAMCDVQANTLMQVAEYLELVMPTEEITAKVTQNAGKIVAAEFRVRYGENAVFKGGKQRINGRACTVKAYERKDDPWILELLRSNIDDLKTEGETKTRAGSRKKQKN
jgi:hypothetical protein